MIIAGALNFRVAASRFENLAREMIPWIKENKNLKSERDAANFRLTLFLRKIWFLLIELKEPVKF